MSALVAHHINVQLAAAGHGITMAGSGPRVKRKTAADIDAAYERIRRQVAARPIPAPPTPKRRPAPRPRPQATSRPSTTASGQSSTAGSVHRLEDAVAKLRGEPVAGIRASRFWVGRPCDGCQLPMSPRTKISINWDAMTATHSTCADRG